MPTAVMKLTPRRNIVWRTVSLTRASTVASPWTRNRSYSWRSRPKATITRSIAIVSWTIERLWPSMPRTWISCGSIRFA